MELRGRHHRGGAQGFVSLCIGWDTNDAGALTTACEKVRYGRREGTSQASVEYTMALRAYEKVQLQSLD